LGNKVRGGAWSGRVSGRRNIAVKSELVGENGKASGRGHRLGGRIGGKGGWR